MMSGFHKECYVLQQVNKYEENDVDVKEYENRALKIAHGLDRV